SSPPDQPVAGKRRSDGGPASHAAGRAQPALPAPRNRPVRRKRRSRGRPGMTGFVSLVGAGPGDPDLLTRKAARRLAEADLVLYDALVSPAALELAGRARRFYVGKRAGRPHVTQDSIHRLMIRAARRGVRVVRLKGGELPDPRPADGPGRAGPAGRGPDRARLGRAHARRHRVVGLARRLRDLARPPRRALLRRRGGRRPRRSRHHRHRRGGVAGRRARPRRRRTRFPRGPAPGRFWRSSMSLALALSEIDDVARRAESWTPQEILGWALERFHPRIAFASSF